MHLEPFKLERYFDLHEFTARYLLSASDCESMALSELLALADPEALALWTGLRLGYTQTQGHPALRAEVAGLYETVSAEGVLIAVPEEAIFILMQALVGPGDHAVVVTPAYQSLYEVARARGCDVTRLDLTPQDSAWRLDLDLLRRSLMDRTRLLVVNFPHNPTGFLPTHREYGELIEIARARGLYLFGDEMYRLLELDAAQRLPAMCDAYEKGISLSGLSKAFGLPGLRLGWLATRETALIARWLAVKDYTTICHSAPSEILGIIALRARDRILERTRAILRANLAAAGDFFAAHSGRFGWIPPQAGPVAFPLWKGPGTVEEFCRGLLEDRGVLIAPGRLFDYPGNRFRIGLGRRNFAEALEQAAAGLDRFSPGG